MSIVSDRMEAHREAFGRVHISKVGSKLYPFSTFNPYFVYEVHAVDSRGAWEPTVYHYQLPADLVISALNAGGERV